LLDLESPDKVLYRSKSYLLGPAVDYELMGDVPNVVFPVASLHDDDGKVAIYYGAADTVTAMAFCKIDEVIAFLKDNSL